MIRERDDLLTNLAGRADAGKNRVVIGNDETASFGCHMPRDERFRDFDIDHLAARCAVDVVVSFDPGIVATRGVGECQFLNLTVLRQQVEGAVDGAVGDLRVLAPHALENLTGGEMLVRFDDGIENHCSLVGLPVSLCPDCCGVLAHVTPVISAKTLVENESRFRFL